MLSDTKKQAGIELAIVAAVFTATLVIGKLAGLKLSGPLSTIMAITSIFILSRRSGASFQPIGLGMPTHKGRAALALVLAVVGTFLIGVFGLEIIKDLVGYDPSAASTRFDYIKGNLTALILSLVGIAWFAAAFGEEVLFRGFLITRLHRLFGETTALLVFVVLLQAVIFGLLHGSAAFNQLAAGAFGLFYGILYVTAAKRSLWPVIVAHAIPDTLSFIQIYSAG